MDDDVDKVEGDCRKMRVSRMKRGRRGRGVGGGGMKYR